MLLLIAIYAAYEFFMSTVRISHNRTGNNLWSHRTQRWNWIMLSLQAFDVAMLIQSQLLRKIHNIGLMHERGHMVLPTFLWTSFFDVWPFIRVDHNLLWKIYEDERCQNEEKTWKPKGYPITLGKTKRCSNKNLWTKRLVKYICLQKSNPRAHHPGFESSNRQATKYRC